MFDWVLNMPLKNLYLQKNELEFLLNMFIEIATHLSIHLNGNERDHSNAT